MQQVLAPNLFTTTRLHGTVQSSQSISGKPDQQGFCCIPLVQCMPSNTVDTCLQVRQMPLAMNPEVIKIYPSLACHAASIFRNPKL
jgi:hypothetical protein